MANKAKHAFGNLADVQAALDDGKINAYDILFLDGDTDPKVGWIDKNGVFRLVENAADISEFEAALAEKANITDIEALELAMANKANLEAFTELETEVSNKIDAVAAEEMIDNKIAEINSVSEIVEF